MRWRDRLLDLLSILDFLGILLTKTTCSNWARIGHCPEPIPLSEKAGEPSIRGEKLAIATPVLSPWTGLKYKEESKYNRLVSGFIRRVHVLFELTENEIKKSYE